MVWVGPPLSRGPARSSSGSPVRVSPAGRVHAVAFWNRFATPDVTVPRHSLVAAADGVRLTARIELFTVTPLLATSVALPALPAPTAVPFLAPAPPPPPPAVPAPAGLTTALAGLPTPP